MLEIVFLIIALTAIGWYARIRGGSPVIWPLIAGAGFAFFFIFGPILFPPPPYETFSLGQLLMKWGWIVAVFFIVRFGLGRGKVKPGGKWVCPKCMFLNSELAIVCEMCKARYTEPKEEETNETSK
jgi:hypothetical protein